MLKELSRWNSVMTPSLPEHSKFIWRRMGRVGDEVAPGAHDRSRPAGPRGAAPPQGIGQCDHGGKLASTCPRTPSCSLRSPTGSEPMRPDVVSRFACRAAADAGFDTHLHALRHFSATLGIAAGFEPVSVGARLGHADPSVTLRVYGHTMEQAATTTWPPLLARRWRCPRPDRALTWHGLATSRNSPPVTAEERLQTFRANPHHSRRSPDGFYGESDTGDLIQAQCPSTQKKPPGLPSGVLRSLSSKTVRPQFRMRSAKLGRCRIRQCCPLPYLYENLPVCAEISSQAM